jgi:hypothetical protein
MAASHQNRVVDSAYLIEKKLRSSDIKIFMGCHLHLDDTILGTGSVRSEAKKLAIQRNQCPVAPLPTPLLGKIDLTLRTFRSQPNSIAAKTEPSTISISEMEVTQHLT